MTRSRLFVPVLLLLIGLGASVNAETRLQSRVPSLGDRMVFGGRPSDSAKAVVVDTHLIMGPWGSDAPYNGQFEDPFGAPDWNGWTSIDHTQTTAVRWHVDTYHAVSGINSAWCGDLSLPSCGGLDTTGGYGNNWNEILEWRGTVANPLLSCVVDVSALVNHDSEPGYDYCYLSLVQGGITNNLWTADGTAMAVPLAYQGTYLTSEYEGAGNDEVVVQFRFVSDGGWSDEDCSWPTAGAIQLDDVQITLSNGTGYSHDFEDGTLGDFEVVFTPGVGDFAHIWTGLQVRPGFDNGNHSPMVAFIDDGIVVPGTGGTQCTTWCYGPDGYIVNNTGGLAGPDAHIRNSIQSPIMAWPGGDYEGSDLSFDIWRDLNLTTWAPGIFFVWSVRSTNSTNPADIENSEWVDRNFVYYGGPDWFRMLQPVGDLIVPDAQWVQIELGIYELGWVWGWAGTDGTPAPYFDNVRLTAFPFYGPRLSATITQLPHDNFPESGVLDLVNLGNNNVRFDMGQETSLAVATSAPGDSIVISVAPQRSGATLVGLPRMYWSLQRNPDFDPYRTSGLPDQGSIDGWPVMQNGAPVNDRFAFDLPDSGFLYPGDFLYYYFEATDVANGVVQTITMPPDTSGFGNFADPMAYPPIYKMHALPTITTDPAKIGGYTQPGILFWDDAGAAGNRDEWYMAYRNLGLVAGVDYDIYYTSNPSANTGHGLDGRATVAQLTGYSDLIYTSGVQTGTILTDPTDGNGVLGYDDIGLLTAWLQLGGKDLLMTGDDLAGYLNRGAGSKAVFLADWMGVDLSAENALPLIGPQTGPLVDVTAANPVFQTIGQWKAVASNLPPVSVYYGTGDNTTGLRRFDGVQARPGAVRLAEFLDPNGLPGQYPFSAATLNVRADYTARVLSFSYDLQSIWTPSPNGDKIDAPLPARVKVLADILTYFELATGPASDVPVNQKFAARHFPNPFNPAVTVAFTMPRAGHLSLKVFDIRGHLVRVLADETHGSGPGQVAWDGRTGRGEMAAAGVYFYEARTGEDVVVGKMALIK